MTTIRPGIRMAYTPAGPGTTVVARANPPHQQRTDAMPAARTKTMRTTTIALCLFAGVAWLPASADDIEDSIQEGLKAYQAGDFQGAAGSLEYAAQLIRQKRGTALQVVLPQPLAGWEAEEATSQAAGAAMFGGLTSVERVYRKGAATVTVRVMADSPMMQGMMMIFANPAAAAASGMKLQRIGDQKAMVKFDAASKDGEVTLAVANRFLVTVEGRGAEQQELMSYAGAVDYKKLQGF